MSAYGFKKDIIYLLVPCPAKRLGEIGMVWSNNLYGSKGISGKARVNRGGIKSGWN